MTKKARKKFREDEYKAGRRTCTYCEVECWFPQFETRAAFLDRYKIPKGIEGRKKLPQLFRATTDHRVPTSKGGRDVVKNYQLLCNLCNSLKGDKLEEELFAA